MKITLKRLGIYDATDFSGEVLQDLLDCAAPGQDASEAVDYFVRVYAVEASDAEALREHLKGYGAWDDDELNDDDENLRRAVWVMATDIKEQGVHYIG